MKTEQPIPNGFSHSHAKESIGSKFQESVLPQIAGLLADAEAAFHNEIRLVEAKFLDRVEMVEQKLIALLLGIGAFILALGLFVITIVSEVTATFPSIPVWAVTGTLSIVTCLIGGFLLTGRSHFRNSIFWICLLDID